MNFCRYCLPTLLLAVLVWPVSPLVQPNKDTATRSKTQRSLTFATQWKLHQVFAILRQSNWSSILLRTLKEEKLKREASTLGEGVRPIADEPSHFGAQESHRRAKRSVQLFGTHERYLADSEKQHSQASLTPDDTAIVAEVNRENTRTSESEPAYNEQASLEASGEETVPLAHETSKSPYHGVTTDTEMLTESNLNRADSSIKLSQLSEQFDASSRFASTSAPEEARKASTSLPELPLLNEYSSSGSDHGSTSNDWSVSPSDNNQPNLGALPAVSTVSSETVPAEAIEDEEEADALIFLPCPANVDHRCVYGECVDLGFELYSCSCDQGYSGVSCEHMDLKAVLVEIRYIGGAEDPLAAASSHPSAYSSAVVVAQYLAGEIKMFR